MISSIIHLTETNNLKKYLALVFILLPGCAVFHDIQIEEHCFEPTTQKTSALFRNEVTQNASIWVYQQKEPYADFYNAKGISGVILPGEHISGKNVFVIDTNTETTLTGRVFKSWPNWAEHYIGPGYKHIKFEVSIGDANYVLMESFVTDSLMAKTNQRCKFE